MRYKATVLIRQTEPQHLYSTDQEKLTAKAVALLVDHEPLLGTTPQKVEIRRQTGTVSGNRADWELINTIEYSSIPEDQITWKQRKRERELRRIEADARFKAEHDAKVEALRDQLFALMKEAGKWSSNILTWAAAKHAIDGATITFNVLEEDEETVGPDTAQRSLTLMSTMTKEITANSADVDAASKRLRLRDQVYDIVKQLAKLDAKPDLAKLAQR